MNGVSIGSDNSLFCANSGLLSIGFLWTNFSKIWTGTLSFSFEKIHLKCCLPKWRPFCPGGDELNCPYRLKWTNVDRILWRHMASQDHKELTPTLWIFYTTFEPNEVIQANHSSQQCNQCVKHTLHLEPELNSTHNLEDSSPEHYLRTKAINLIDWYW